jgi:hypothetical protein
MYKLFWLENLEGRDQSEDNIRIDVREVGMCELDATGSG